MIIWLASFFARSNPGFYYAPMEEVTAGGKQDQRHNR